MQINELHGPNFKDQNQLIPDSLYRFLRTPLHSDHKCQVQMDWPVDIRDGAPS